MKLLIATIFASLLLSTCPALGRVKLARVPENGLQPQVIARDGVVHLIYLTGDPASSEIRYRRSADAGIIWSAPILVNDASSRGIAVGTVRGPHLAVGRDGIVHIAWMASPKAMFYARLQPGAKAFESPRNLVTTRSGLDSGGSIAADAAGRVYVAWHAPSDNPNGDEATRKLWLTTSTDDGKTFSAERAIFDRPTGACGCCGIRLHASAGGDVLALYRGAAEMTHRGMFLLTSTDHGQTFRGKELAAMTMGVCLMSTTAIIDTDDGALGAWETKGKLFWGRINADTTSVEQVIAVPKGDQQKHPALSVSSTGDILFAWTEGTRFGKGGSIAWQVYDSKQRPRPDQHGKADGIPVFGLPAAFDDDHGNFTILY